MRILADISGLFRFLWISVFKCGVAGFSQFFPFKFSVLLSELLLRQLWVAILQTLSFTFSYRRQKFRLCHIALSEHCLRDHGSSGIQGKSRFFPKNRVTHEFFRKFHVVIFDVSKFHVFMFDALQDFP